MKLFICIFVGLCLIQGNVVQGKTYNKCSKEEAMFAEKEAANIKDWNSLYVSFGKFLHCDDGAIADGYSNSIAYLLAEKWNTLNELEKFISVDNNFERFVLRHIDETFSQPMVTSILDNIKFRCPKGMERLCDLIKSQLVHGVGQK